MVLQISLKKFVAIELLELVFKYPKLLLHVLFANICIPFYR